LKKSNTGPLSDFFCGSNPLCSSVESERSTRIRELLPQDASVIGPIVSLTGPPGRRVAATIVPRRARRGRREAAGRGRRRPGRRPGLRGSGAA
jgi:hypothetical protein